MTLAALRVGRYLVRFSSRSVLNLLLDYAGVPQERSGDVFRVLDKLEKMGMEKVRLELMHGYKDESGDTIRGLGLHREQVGRIEQFLAIKSDSRHEVISQLRELFSGVTDAPAQIDAVARISDHLYALGYGDDRVALDLSIARGLAYYTGPVFEAILLDAPQFGSVFGGGRYDDLVMRFLGQAIPAVGASIFDRAPRPWMITGRRDASDMRTSRCSSSGVMPPTADSGRYGGTNPVLIEV